MTTFCDGKIDNKDEAYMMAVVVVFLLTSLLLSIVEMAGRGGAGSGMVPSGLACQALVRRFRFVLCTHTTGGKREVQCDWALLKSSVGVVGTSSNANHVAPVIQSFVIRTRH